MNHLSFHLEELQLHYGCVVPNVVIDVAVNPVLSELCSTTCEELRLQYPSNFGFTLESSLLPNQSNLWGANQSRYHCLRAAPLRCYHLYSGYKFYHQYRRMEYHQHSVVGSIAVRLGTVVPCNTLFTEDLTLNHQYQQILNYHH